MQEYFRRSRHTLPFPLGNSMLRSFILFEFRIVLRLTPLELLLFQHRVSSIVPRLQRFKPEDELSEEEDVKPGWCPVYGDQPFALYELVWNKH